MIKIIRAKLHGIHVTASELDYHGSITLDPEQCRLAGILPLEFVEIWNKNSGHRLSTYVIYGTPGSRCCILNGAAARTCQPGDALIICASEFINSPQELAAKAPAILCFDDQNAITEILHYHVQPEKDDTFSFSIDS